LRSIIFPPYTNEMVQPFAVAISFSAVVIELIAPPDVKAPASPLKIIVAVELLAVKSGNVAIVSSAAVLLYKEPSTYELQRQGSSLRFSALAASVI